MIWLLLLLIAGMLFVSKPSRESFTPYFDKLVASFASDKGRNTMLATMAFQAAKAMGAVQFQYKDYFLYHSIQVTMAEPTGKQKNMNFVGVLGKWYRTA
jgi:hypothetical protein